jgi:type II secretory pathway pseudopilin PulG
MSAGSHQQGFTLAGALILIAVAGAGMAAYGEMASHAAQREKEQELLFVGNQFRQAIGAFYDGTPGAAKQFPRKLEDLLQDQRHPVPRRHLRRIYADPMSGKPEWGLISAPGGGIMGIFSLSQAQPIKSGGFALRDRQLEGARERYADWQFTYTPAATPAAASTPAATPAAAVSSANRKPASPAR